jgi:hypothetical protein
LPAEGFDPDDPVVIAAVDLVRWELSLVLESPHCGRPGEDAAVDSNCWLSVRVDNAIGEDPDVQQNHHYGGEMGSGFSSHRVFESFRTRK